MNAVRFGFYAGILWTLVSLILIVASVMIGYRFAWVELDFRILSGALFLAANALGFGDSVSGLAFYAETGLPVTPLHVIFCAAVSFADGFASGLVIALIYNAINRGKGGSIVRKALSFGVAAGIALGVASVLLALTCMTYGVGIVSFDFTVRPVWLAFYFWSKLGVPDFLLPLRDSYMYFPKNLAGALAWAAWGFIDGLVEGTVIAYLFLKVREVFRT
ncbi:MAG: hypothetical protein AB1598_05545 [Thermodesulfobacteriota bacterium]